MHTDTRVTTDTTGFQTMHVSKQKGRLANAPRYNGNDRYNRVSDNAVEQAQAACQYRDTATTTDIAGLK